jgi:hypothetical protein
VLPGGATTGLHFDIGPTAGAERQGRAPELQSSAVGSETGFMLKPPQSRVQKAPWLTTRCRLTRAPAPSCHNRAARMQNARAKMAIFSFLSHKTKKMIGRTRPIRALCAVPPPCPPIAPPWVCPCSEAGCSSPSISPQRGRRQHERGVMCVGICFVEVNAVFIPRRPAGAQTPAESVCGHPLPPPPPPQYTQSLQRNCHACAMAARFRRMLPRAQRPASCKR